MILDAILLILFGVVPAIVAHEVAHGFAALLLGDTTARDQGRLTLNPLKHLDPLGSVIVPGGLFLAHLVGLMPSLVLFGWAKPVPVDFRRLRFRRLGMIVVAMAGPLTNIVLAGGIIFLFKLSFLASWAHVLGWGIMLNLTLAVFNMIPIPPLDGSRVVMGILPKEIARYYARLEPYGLFIVLILLQLGILRFMYPLISALGSMLGVQL